MNWKKLYISDQFPWLKRKVLSGFGLGVLISLIVLTVISLSHLSVKPMFLGFQSVRVNASSSNSIRNSSSATSELQNPKDLVFKFEEGRFLDKTHFENESEIHLNENLDGDDGKGAVLKMTQFANLTENVRNGKFNVDDGTLERNGPVGSEKVTPFNGGIHLGNASKIVENGTVFRKEGSLKNVSNGENESSGNSIVGNVSYNGEVGYSSGEEEKSLGNNITIVNVTSQVKKIKSDFYEECDIFDGKWVRDDSKPYYPGGSCPYIDRDFDCHLNRRPDDGYVKWKWQPNGCDIPR